MLVGLSRWASPW